MCHRLRSYQKLHHATHRRLIERIADQDQTALSDLYSETRSMAFHIALRVLSDREAAEEAVQDAYLQIWRRAHSYDPQRGSPLAWIITIVRARSLDRLRKLSRELREAAPEAEWRATSNDSRWSDSRSELKWLVQSALSQLKVEQRTLIIQAYYGGLSHRELAARLEIPLGTIKTRIRSAMQRLRVSLECQDPTGLLD